MARTQDTLISALMGLLSLSLLLPIEASFPYYGTKIGSLKRLHHGVSGDVYAVDSRTIFVKGFNYDGEAPAAYFYVGNTNKPTNEGAHRLRDERGGTASLTRRYRNKDITLSLPEGKTLRDVKWFSVWCDEFAVNFGDVSIPSNLEYPRPQKISPLKGVHGVSSDSIVIVDAQTLLVPNFSYDGEAPDAKFWVGRGAQPSPQGLRIPDENGKENPLRRYDRKTIVLTLPGDLTIFDIGHFGVWCEAFTVDFGHVRVPEGLNVPPSLKMLGISPQSKLNCEVLYDDLAFEVRWAVAGESIVVQLVAKLADKEYMSFGISPSKDKSEMIGADVVVAWVDKDSGKGVAQDYFLDDKSQCSGGRGVCPDTNIKENTNSVRLLNAANVNGYSIVTYQRSLQPADQLDLPISVNGSEAIVWAIGPLNERKECSFHTHYTKRTHLIDFGRQPTWNCPMPEGAKMPDEDEEEEDADNSPDDASESTVQREPEAEYYDNRAQALHRPHRNEPATSQREVPTPKPTSTEGAWDIPAIQCYEPEDGVFYAQMGPTGGKHGYSAITGHVGWGISWYINGLLIPEIHVVRGKTYTFVVEGGNNPDVPAKYHPFYITDDPVGGYEHKREEEKKAIRIFAGVHRSRSGQITPIGVGRLCNWTPDPDGPPADDYQSFGAYQRTLTLKCDAGEPGVITWKPDQNTPDTVYYHCFTHRYLGWKIHVHDSCDDNRGAASEHYEIRIPAATEAVNKDSDATKDIESASSVRHETKVSPNANFLLKHQTDLIKNHNMNGTPPKLSFELTKSSEITKLISDGIRAAEALEESIKVHNKVASPSAQVPALPNNPYQNPQLPSNNPKPNPSHFSEAGALSYKVPQPYPSIGIGSGGPPQLIPQRPLHMLHGESNKYLYRNPQSQTHIHTHSHPSDIQSSNPSLHVHTQSHHIHKNHEKNNITNFPAQLHKTISLSEYLRPPHNAAIFHPVKLPGRRPINPPAKKAPGHRPVPVLPQQLPRQPLLSSAIPQPSVIVSHYRKPLPSLLKPFLKEKPFPLQPPIAASVLLLGQPTELTTHHTKSDPYSLKPKPIIPVPYGDLVPQDSLQNSVFTLNSNKGPTKDKKPIYPKTRPALLPTPSTPPPVFKKPFEIHEVKDESLSPDLASMKPAVNNGFKPDSVVVESGFKPIIRHDSKVPQPITQMANRREDISPGSEIDEAMAADTLFLTANNGIQTQNFEPVFIPSPPDTNATIVIRKIVPSSPLRNSAALVATTTTSTNAPTTIGIHTSSSSVIKIDEQSDDSDEMSKEADKDMEEEQQDEDENYYDKEAQESERVESYYLPPQHSKTALEDRPYAGVVAFDGKHVFDSTIVSPPQLNDASEDSAEDEENNGRISKLEQLIRTTPQFAPFNGEIPQKITAEPHNVPVTEYTSPSSTQQDKLPEKEQETHPSSSVSPRPLSTKLQLLKNLS